MDTSTTSPGLLVTGSWFLGLVSCGSASDFVSDHQQEASLMVYKSCLTIVRLFFFSSRPQSFSFYQSIQLLHSLLQHQLHIFNTPSYLFNHHHRKHEVLCYCFSCLYRRRRCPELDHCCHWLCCQGQCLPCQRPRHRPFCQPGPVLC